MSLTRYHFSTPQYVKEQGVSASLCHQSPLQPGHVQGCYPPVWCYLQCYLEKVPKNLLPSSPEKEA